MVDKRGAAEKVFGTPELLEHILLQPLEDAQPPNDFKRNMQTVLRSQRVNKTFQATIQGSIQLKRKLWLVPPAADCWWQINPLFASAENPDDPASYEGYSKVGAPRRVRFMFVLRESVVPEVWIGGQHLILAATNVMYRVHVWNEKFRVGRPQDVRLECQAGTTLGEFLKKVSNQMEEEERLGLI